MTANKSVETISKHDLSLGGHSLVISSDLTKEKIDKIAKLANTKISYSLNNNVSFQRGLMLSLLQSCEEILELKSEMRSKIEELEKQAEVVLDKFNASLG